jgi:copper transporter 1
MDMDMSPSAGTSTMTSFLHFAGGDMLLFHSLHPSSPGALAGAALVLFLIAVFERWLAAFRGAMDARWRERFVRLLLIA